MRRTKRKAKNAKNTANKNTHTHTTKYRSVARSSDQPVQLYLHGELGEENPYLHDGGIELLGEVLDNHAHDQTHMGLVLSTRENSKRSCS